MLRLWVWFASIWNSDDGRFDRLARRHPVQACLVVGVAFGLLEWLLADAFSRSVQPVDTFLATFIVGAVMIGPVLVWVRRSRVGRG